MSLLRVWWARNEMVWVSIWKETGAEESLAELMLVQMRTKAKRGECGCEEQ